MALPNDSVQASVRSLERLTSSPHQGVKAKHVNAARSSRTQEGPPLVRSLAERDITDIDVLLGTDVCHLLER